MQPTPPSSGEDRICYPPWKLRGAVGHGQWEAQRQVPILSLPEGQLVTEGTSCSNDALSVRPWVIMGQSPPQTCVRKKPELPTPHSLASPRAYRVPVREDTRL